MDNPYLIPVHIALIFFLIGMGIFFFITYEPLKKVSKQYGKLKKKALKSAKKRAAIRHFRDNPDFEI